MFGYVWVQVIIAFFLDLVLGDPRWLPHPVVGIGKAILFLEKRLRKDESSPGVQRAAGLFSTLVIVAGTYLAVLTVLRWAEHVWKPAGLVLHTILLYTAIAVRSLNEHVLAVKAGLKTNLTAARHALAQVVGRDTAHLDESEVARAAIETAAENTCDGIIAPMFYAFIGGAPLALAYKAINTLDSMIGYRDERYLHFGLTAAKIDDLANYLPARLTGLLMIAGGYVLGYGWSRGWKTMRRDARKHESPNSGYPEAAMAGILGVRLGGVNCYRGRALTRPLLGEEGGTPAEEHIDYALRLVQITAWIGLGLGAIIRAAV
ncbi:MAG: adenosylcobinamide-phosphate synthase CbiB [Bacillota bacterium]